jgi:DNA-binding response OmpR family regulator
MSRILVVEDEQHIAEGLRFNLIAEGYSTDVVDNGEAALEKLAHEPFDLVVLDVMLPGMDGFAVASDLRKSGKFVPILMLTARARAEDVLKGFESGADDYLPKPFELSILIARIKGLLRRHKWLRESGEPKKPEVFSFNGRVIDFDALQVSVGDKVLPLTLMEADLLRYLIRHQGKAVSRKMILEQVWNVREDTDTRAIDNFIVRLRRYLEPDPSHPMHLLTVRGVGYRFVFQPESSGK